MAVDSTYRSDTRPDFAPFEESLRRISGFQYRRRPGHRARRRHDSPAEALDLLDDMLAIRELEEMIVRLRSGGYDAAARLRLPRPHARLHRPGGHRRRRLLRAARRRQRSPAPTAATATRSPRASPPSAQMNDEQLAGPRPGPHRRPRERAPRRPPSRTTSSGPSPSCSARRRATAGAAAAACTSRDFSTGHLGANAIVGGGVPIATGAAMAARYERLGPRSCAASPATAPTPTASSSSRSTGPPGPVDQPPGRRPAVRPAGHLRHPEQPLRHDPPHRRRGHGRRAPRPARRRLRRATTCTPRSSTAWTCSPSATPSARGGDLSARGEGPVLHRGRAPTATTATRCPTRATSTGPATRRPPGGPSTRSSASRASCSRPASLTRRPSTAVETRARDRNARGRGPRRRRRPTRIRRTSSSTCTPTRHADAGARRSPVARAPSPRRPRPSATRTARSPTRTPSARRSSRR